MIAFKKGIAFKLGLISSLSVIVLFCILFGLYHHFTSKIIENNAIQNAKNLTLATVLHIENRLQPVEQAAKNIADILECSSPQKEELVNMIKVSVEKTPGIFGTGVAFAPFAFSPSTRYFFPYYFYHQDKFSLLFIGSEEDDYFKEDFFLIPRETQKKQWSEPYYDDGISGVLMTTYSVPFYRNTNDKKIFLGVVSADISLEWLIEMVSKIKLLNTGFVFLISKNGTFLTHPDHSLIMNETIFGLAEESNNQDLRSVGREMIAGRTGLISSIAFDNNHTGLLYYAPVSVSGWSLAFFFPHSELMADRDRLNRIILALGILGAISIFIVIVSETRIITAPLTFIANATTEISKGNFDAHLPLIKRDDEIGALSLAFRTMQSSLKEYIAQLTTTTAAKERIESELTIAHDIQLSILPKIFPPFDGMEELDLYALVKSAREVGGDLYDFYTTEHDHFCFLIGDVSGKGVPASLFMAVTKTLFKATSAKNTPPEIVMEQINNELSSGNDNAMFVSTFFGNINTATGEIEFANGGHNLPLLIKKGGSPQFINKTQGMVVGAIEGVRFERGRLTLQPGDRLFLYTDGITEARNKKGELFSDKRLITELEQLTALPVKEVLERLLTILETYSEGEQYDDITMMLLEYKGRTNSQKG